ncbi:MAG TPA: hypothetical protein VFP32_02340, partial [Candidatus Saccharimonadales bacterium]|nr:hypothetical protein [Candidatus Saccharimonadales bacterium]
MAIQPTSRQLQSLIGKVRAYPVSVGQILELAARSKVPKEVKDFYRAFPDDEVFESKDDLAARTEQVELLRSEDDMPQEIERCAEE